LLGNAMTRDVDGLTSRDGRVAAVENKWTRTCTISCIYSILKPVWKYENAWFLGQFRRWKFRNYSTGFEAHCSIVSFGIDIHLSVHAVLLPTDLCPPQSHSRSPLDAVTSPSLTICLYISTLPSLLNRLLFPIAWKPQ
jgi:hypothetical protein